MNVQYSTAYAIMFKDVPGFSNERGSLFSEAPATDKAFENWTSKWKEYQNENPIDIELVIDFENREWFIDDERIGEVFTDNIIGYSFMPAGNTGG